MLKKLQQQFEQRPLVMLLMVAFVARLVAVFFAKGYLWHDDHFLTIEPSSSWAAGFNFNDWLPGIGNSRTEPEPISFFYLGFLFVFFKLFHFIGIDSPDSQMYLLRLIHAAYSLLTVFFVYRITEKISNKKYALQAGLLIALIGVFPNFSVRNLVEFVCQPPLLAGIYLLLKGQVGSGGSIGWKPERTSYSWKYVALAALVMGLAVGIRYQTVLMVAGVGFVLLVQGNITKAMVFGGLSFFAFFITQMDDVILWGGKPFQHLFGYFEYNKTHAGNYPHNPFTYLSLIGYILLPPAGLFLFFGFFKSFKKHGLVFIPAFFFICFHIIYPNRQERFIFPAIPFIIILGVIGWNEFVATSSFWSKREKLHRSLWRFFWILNTIVLLIMSSIYTKQSRVEAMLYLNKQKDCKNFIQDFSYSNDGAIVPQFYSGEWPHYYVFRKNTDIEKLVAAMPHNEEIHSRNLTPQPVPNYILFFNDPDLDERVFRAQQLFPSLAYQATIEPGWFDVLLNTINPLNTLEKVYVYKIQ